MIVYFRVCWSLPADFSLTGLVAESLSVAEPEDKVNSSPGSLLQQQHDSADEDGDSRGR